MPTAQEFRAQARRYRELARHLLSPDAGERLRTVADELDREANALDRSSAEPPDPEM
jgi:hypothetical protein